MDRTSHPHHPTHFESLDMVAVEGGAIDAAAASDVHGEIFATQAVGVEIVVDLAIPDYQKSLEDAGFELGWMNQDSHSSVVQMMQLIQ